jgi:hypothetical protein
VAVDVRVAAAAPEADGSVVGAHPEVSSGTLTDPAPVAGAAEPGETLSPPKLAGNLPGESCQTDVPHFSQPI